MDTLFFVFLIAFVAMLIWSDVLVLRHINRSKYTSQQRTLYTLLVLLLPLVGMFIYWCFVPKR